LYAVGIWDLLALEGDAKLLPTEASAIQKYTKELVEADQQRDGALRKVVHALQDADGGAARDQIFKDFESDCGGRCRSLVFDLFEYTQSSLSSAGGGKRIRSGRGAGNTHGSGAYCFNW
jgi:hypothetical protein